ncbi:cache domain-containing sensor histidine kinase [Clostridium folliculivorans]|uniref:Sensor histidine kinase n=1 Tax=Clostridium folliculivorans TaxID=2886038 RepID=A0A9W6DD98_9CLOT|nr:sensor histidine kinase [Clostridium folliculivorans]GKU27662.1 sensor histidine kinase [Clostridium folliculivorans]GKU32425.1 sensor histidine kinase [Clostridium folliculivorans]
MLKRKFILKKGSLYNSFFRITAITLMVVTIIISAVMNFYSNRIIYSDLTAYLYSAQSELCQSMDLVINDVNMASVRLLSRQVYNQIINDDSITYEEKQRRIKEQLLSQMKEYDNIADVVIITKEGKSYRMADDEKLSLPDKNFLDKIDDSGKITYSDGVVKDKNGQAYIMIGRKFRNLDTGRINGYLVTYVKSNNLIKIYNHLLVNNSFSMIVNSEGKIMSSMDSESIGETIYDYKFSSIVDKKLNHIDFKGEKMVVANTAFDKQLKDIGFNWYILTYIKEENIDMITRQISYNVWIISTVSAVIAIALSFLTVAYILKPLRRLQAAMKGFKGGKQSIGIAKEAKVHDEFFELEKAYVDMVERIDELIVKNNEEKEKQRELELAAMQAQINPHFLYNTLDTIVWMAKIKKEPDIEKITMALSRFFRMSLHKGEKYITISEEISLIQSFVVIEQMRFPNELQISYNIPDDILDEYILKLTIQPIVENALKHGVRGKKENGRIEINGMKYDNMLIFEVIDNGKGFDPKMLDEFDNLDKSKSGGYGLKNVDERIKLEYGSKYGISILSQPNKGTTVIIRVARREKQ